MASRSKPVMMRFCPECGKFVTVRRGVIDEHRRNRGPVVDCSAGGKPYRDLVMKRRAA